MLNIAVICDLSCKSYCDSLVRSVLSPWTTSSASSMVVGLRFRRHLTHARQDLLLRTPNVEVPCKSRDNLLSPRTNIERP